MSRRRPAPTVSALAGAAAVLGLVAACARLSGLDGLVRDDCAFGCDDGGDEGLDARRADASTDARDAADARDAPPVDTVPCGAGRCATSEACCMTGPTTGSCERSVEGGCRAPTVKVNCDETADCTQRFSSGYLCCGSPENAQEITSVLCKQQPQCDRPLCDPRLPDAGCAAAQTCKPVVPGATVGVCTTS